MSFDKILNKKVTLTQVKSYNKLVKRQKATLLGLGLRGIRTTSELMASRDVIGMIKKVSHLIKVSDI
ncbi:MAG: large subunit ribosomal protein L30 [Rickettsiales bacterium]|jgi:large subunit ribosomal protein L30